MKVKIDGKPFIMTFDYFVRNFPWLLDDIPPFDFEPNDTVYLTVVSGSSPNSRKFSVRIVSAAHT